MGRRRRSTWPRAPTWVHWRAMADPRLPTDELFSLLAEVALGVGADKSALPNTQVVRDTRARLVKEVAALRAKGIEPDVPHEW